MYNHLHLVKLSTVATHHIWSSRLVEAVSCCENCCLVKKSPTALNLRYKTNQINKGHFHHTFTMIEITLWFWLRNSSVGIFESVHFPPLGKCWLLPKICCWRYSWFPGPQPTASLLAWHDFCFNIWFSLCTHLDSVPPTIRLFAFVPQLSSWGAAVVGRWVVGCGVVGCGVVGGCVVGLGVVGLGVVIGGWFWSSQHRVKSKPRKPQGERMAWKLIIVASCHRIPVRKNWRWAPGLGRRSAAASLPALRLQSEPAWKENLYWLGTSFWLFFASGKGNKQF